MPETAVSSTAQTLASSKAFETFYQREREAILRALVFVLGEEDALDAFEAAMAQAFDRWADVRGLDNPAGWVVRAALLAAPHRRSDRPTEHDDEDDKAAAPADADAAIAEGLDQLALEQRAALVLRFHLDWSVEQVAEALEQPVDTVKGHIYRGLSRLRTLLAEARQTTELEERLRKHFTHRSERLRLPVPAVNDELARIVEGAGRRRRGPGTNTNLVLRRGLPAVAIAVALLLVAFVVVGGDEKDDPVAAQGPRATTTALGSQDAQPAEAPTTTAAPPAPPPATTAQPTIVGPYGELGWWDGSAWVTSRPGTPLPVQGGETYQIVGLDQPADSRVAAFSTELCPTDPTKVGLQAIDAGYGPRESWPALIPIAVSGVAEPRPRPVSVLDPGAAAYKTAAAETLGMLGVQDPDPQVVQVLRTDLDADGFDDVLVVAERIANFDAVTARLGDYSVVFVRRGAALGVSTTVVAKAFPYGTPGADGLQPIDSLRIAAVADLNGDGRMEMVIQNDHPGGHTTAVWELLPDGNPVAVIGRECKG